MNKIDQTPINLTGTLGRLSTAAIRLLDFSMIQALAS